MSNTRRLWSIRVSGQGPPGSYLGMLASQRPSPQSGLQPCSTCFDFILFFVLAAKSHQSCQGSQSCVCHSGAYRKHSDAPHPLTHTQSGGPPRLLGLICLGLRPSRDSAARLAQLEHFVFHFCRPAWRAVWKRGCFFLSINSGTECGHFPAPVSEKRRWSPLLATSKWWQEKKRFWVVSTPFIEKDIRNGNRSRKEIIMPYEPSPPQHQWNSRL